MLDQPLLLKLGISLGLFALLTGSGFTQGKGPSRYPQGYFRNPLDLPMSLSGNFGEPRPNHFHMGLDLRTQLRENLKVHASASGFVSRVKIEPWGFGRALYIEHPNGYTTVYAHLNAFYPELERWILQQQYLQRSWKLDLGIAAGRFPVTKGQFIALSGNTGGSEAPHLHYEIRRTQDGANLNPLYFGLPLADAQSPQLLKLAVYDRTRSTYEQEPAIYTLRKKQTGIYTLLLPIIKTASPQVSLALSAFDLHDGSTNRNGVSSAQLLVDGVLKLAFDMDQINYTQTRYLNAHIDYKTRARTGQFLQHLSELPGYRNSVYTKHGGGGVIDLSDREVHQVKIIVKDAAGHSSRLEVALQWSGERRPGPVREAAMLYCSPGKKSSFETSTYSFTIGENCLYDTAAIGYFTDMNNRDGAVSAVHTIGSSAIPLQESVLIRLKPSRSLSGQEQAQTLMLWTRGSKNEVQRTTWEQGWAVASFREFGSFQLVLDQEPPQIIPVNFGEGSKPFRASKLIFTVTDNWQKIKNVVAELDGKWLCFSNDKGKNFIYTMDEHCPPGPHQLRVWAEDEAGNPSQRIFRITTR